MAENPDSSNPAGVELPEMLRPAGCAASAAIRHIPGPSVPENPVERAKGHWLGQLYVRHAKRYSLVRAVVNRSWLLLFPLYRCIQRSLVGLLSRAPVMPLVSQSVFVRTHRLRTTVLAECHKVVTPAPRAYPPEDQGYLKSPHSEYTFPETYVAEFPDALVQGGTNIVVARSCAVHHDLFARTEDFTSEELHDRIDLNVVAGTVVWRALDPAPEFMDVAASFVDACAPNYAHWLTEVAPRIALLCARSEFDGVPLIVNDGLHPNIMESLLTLAANRHPIVALPLGRSVRVAHLYLVSCAGYVPFEPRGGVYTAEMSHGKFSRRAFEVMRKACLDLRESISMPKKIFLRRNSGLRRLLNSDVIEALLVSQGFTVVEPEKLGFTMQVQLFQNADVIIGATGAAMANIIFSNSRAHIAILISQQEGFIYWYWQNIACASGGRVRYIIGEKISQNPNNIHVDFYVPPEYVTEFTNDLRKDF